MSKRLMPTYLIKFLESIYQEEIPSNFGKIMVTRQFIAKVKALYYEIYNEKIADYGRRMVPEYLVDYFSAVDYIEYTDEDIAYVKEFLEPHLKWLQLNYIGGASEVVEGEIVNATVTSIVVSSDDDESAKEIPSDILDLEGYGLGINEDCYNYIDFKNKKFIQKVGSYTFTGQEDWVNVGGSYPQAFDATISDIQSKSGVYANRIGLCNNYQWIQVASVSDNGIRFADGSKNRVYIYDNRYSSDLAGFKAFLQNNPTTLLYELETPIETDISELIPEDFELFNIDKMDSITFENENELEIPNSITYYAGV